MPSLTLDWLHVIILLGAIQGLFLAVALASKRRNRTANRLLAAAMLACCAHHVVDLRRPVARQRDRHQVQPGGVQRVQENSGVAGQAPSVVAVEYLRDAVAVLLHDPEISDLMLVFGEHRIALDVRGYVGISLFGRTTTWKRVG